MSNWLQKITEAIADAEADKPEAGFYTAQEWEKRFGLARAQTNTRLRKLLDLQLAEVRQYRIKAGNRTYLAPVPHYKILAKAKRKK